MTITFNNDNDIIVYAFEKLFAYARGTQQIFLAQCVWWLASIIGLDQGLINHIDNLQSRVDVTVDPQKAAGSKDQVARDPSQARQDKVLEETEEFLLESRRFIRNNSSFRLKHQGVPDSSDSSDGTSYPLTENYTLPVAQATGPSLLD
jgi:hypothetical protein